LISSILISPAALAALARRGLGNRPVPTTTPNTPPAGVSLSWDNRQARPERPKREAL